jgi:hypothetical protein
MTKEGRRPGCMPRWQRWAFWLGMGLCLLSGTSYWLGREMFIGTAWLGHRNMLSLHGISAGLAVFLLGTVAVGHIRVGWILRKNRLTGVGNVVALSLLVLSGWGLYYGPEAWRDGTVLAHWVLGLGFAGVLAAHVMPFSIRAIATIHWYARQRLL